MMKKVKKGSAIIALLALVLSTVVIPKAYAAKEIVLTEKGSIEFNLDGVSYDEVKGLKIAVDLYQIATVDKVGNYTAKDGYTLGTINDETSAEAWQEMAADAMAVIETNGIEPTDSSNVAEGFADLDLGLYLVVANNAKSDTYEYSFIPYLISLPNNYYYNPDEASDGLQTPDEWVYNVTTSLKPERTDRYGDLVIEKNLKSFNATVGGATFVFQVEAVKDYKLGLEGEAELKTVYSDVVALTFDAAGKQSLTIEKIPAGAVVTVTEIYSGGSYKVTGSGEFETVILANEAYDQVVEETTEEVETATVTFVNDYDGSLNGGTGVVNHFEAKVIDEDLGTIVWDWANGPEPDVAE